MNRSGLPAPTASVSAMRIILAFTPVSYVFGSDSSTEPADVVVTVDLAQDGAEMPFAPACCIDSRAVFSRDNWLEALRLALPRATVSEPLLEAGREFPTLVLRYSRAAAAKALKRGCE